jgi:hypothetical protein
VTLPGLKSSRNVQIQILKNDNKQLKWWELLFLSQYFLEQTAENEAFIVNFIYYSWQHFPGIKPLESLNVFLGTVCPMPVPNKWNTIEELINGGKYEVIKTTEGQCKLKVKGSRGDFMQMQLTMF